MPRSRRGNEFREFEQLEETGIQWKEVVRKGFPDQVAPQRKAGYTWREGQDISGGRGSTHRRVEAGQDMPGLRSSIHAPLCVCVWREVGAEKFRERREMKRWPGSYVGNGFIN